MQVVFILGSSSVGKMTVGQELTKITDLRLCHNHHIIEPVLEIFGEFHAPVIKDMRDVVYRHFAKSEHQGIIITLMYAFDAVEDVEYLHHVEQVFVDSCDSVEFYYVELVASQEVRLQRNTTDNRLLHKASKRDVEMSNKRLLAHDQKYRMVSNEEEVQWEHYIKIDNSALSAQDTARRIKDEFQL